VLVCEGGTSGTAELCNNLDDDCDGFTDEGNPGGGAPCYGGPAGTSGVGICEPGVLRCISASLVCDGEVRPGVEDCNGLDDDCDRSTDEELAAGGTCGTDEGECRSGTRRCEGGAWVCPGEVGPTEEVCDRLDNDCDGSTDEGNPGGGLLCGWDPDDRTYWSTGLCRPGVTNCVSGVTACEGMVGPVPEVCNGLDDDCNGSVDDGLSLGEECGTGEGECEPGRLQCVGGAVACVGAVGGRPEMCDCLDNDCDAETDEEATCPGGSICLECTCATPCIPGNEFACPTGKICECGLNPEDPSGCYCVEDLCGGVRCPRCQDCESESCVPIDCGECRVCDPMTEACVDACAGVTCEGGLRCVCGECIVPNCYLPGHECPAGERCRAGACETDPCYTVPCDAPQFCRDGLCRDPCEETIVCGEGEICFDGVCEADPCWDVSCGTGEVCVGGECSTRCAEVECARPLVCDPATGLCREPACYYVTCPSGYVCRDGTCEERGGGEDGGTDGGDVGDGSTTGRQVLATGAGGCGCAAPGGGGSGLPLLLALFAGMLGLGRRRRR
jgi:MYXO-CTERM domain-containing protein